MAMKTLLSFVALFVTACAAPDPNAPPLDLEFAKQFLTAVGNDVLMHEGTQALMAHADGRTFVGLFDVNPKDGHLSVEELGPVLNAPANPQNAAMLTIMILGIMRARNER